jgi:iodotyrosine deiodinase
MAMKSSSTTFTLTHTVVIALASAGIAAAFVRKSRHGQPRSRDDDNFFQAGQGTPKDSSDNKEPCHAPYLHEQSPLTDISHRVKSFRQLCESRRTLRFFSNDPVPRHILQDIIATAATAPSGAHKQPWHFCLIGNPKVKKEIRNLVEKEEQINYYLKDIISGMHDTKSISKPYLTEAPWLIVVLKQLYDVDETGKRVEDYYYVPESVGIACGMLVTAIHNANLVTLTSTPTGANANICKLLQRPNNEKVCLLLPVGFPAKDATVPYRDLQRKQLDQVLSVY